MLTWIAHPRRRKLLQYKQQCHSFLTPFMLPMTEPAPSFSRDDKTAIELFVAEVEGWQIKLRGIIAQQRG
jgi:hypothetical protein